MLRVAGVAARERTTDAEAAPCRSIQHSDDEETASTAEAASLLSLASICQPKDNLPNLLSQSPSLSIACGFCFETIVTFRRFSEHDM